MFIVSFFLFIYFSVVKAIFLLESDPLDVLNKCWFH